MVQFDSGASAFELVCREPMLHGQHECIILDSQARQMRPRLETIELMSLLSCRVQAWLHELNRQRKAQEAMRAAEAPQYAFSAGIAAEYLTAAVRSGYMDKLAQGGAARCSFWCGCRAADSQPDLVDSMCVWPQAPEDAWSSAAPSTQPRRRVACLKHQACETLHAASLC